MKKLLNPQSKIGYRFMIWTFWVMDLFAKPDKRLDDFDIQKGSVVVDYGCGPGRYVCKAARQVGPAGQVYAADIQPMAIDLVKQKTEKYKLTNVTPVLLGENAAAIPDHSADVVYALDMFHQIEDPVAFMDDIHRVIKPKGVLYLEDGHQPRSSSLEKIGKSEKWRVVREHAKHIELAPTTA